MQRQAPRKDDAGSVDAVVYEVDVVAVIVADIESGTEAVGSNRNGAVAGLYVLLVSDLCYDSVLLCNGF